jgi:hypothetical protein
MKRQMYGMSLLVASLAALALSGPATAGQQAQAPVARKQGTFLARSSGMVTTESVAFPVPNGPPVISFKLVGEGQSAPLGHFTVTAQVVLTVATGSAAGPWTLTAANGDQLFVSLVGYTTEEAQLLGLVNGLQGGGFFTIEGGTGRFQGATGSYTQLITFASDPGKGPAAYSDMLVGTISTPGSNQ